MFLKPSSRQSCQISNQLNIYTKPPDYRCNMDPNFNNTLFPVLESQENKKINSFYGLEKTDFLRFHCPNCPGFSWIKIKFLLLLLWADLCELIFCFQPVKQLEPIKQLWIVFWKLNVICFLLSLVPFAALFLNFNHRL